jgi:hypothetical protein
MEVAFKKERKKDFAAIISYFAGQWPPLPAKIFVFTHNSISV